MMMKLGFLLFVVFVSAVADFKTASCSLCAGWDRSACVASLSLNYTYTEGQFRDVNVTTSGSQIPERFPSLRSSEYSLTETTFNDLSYTVTQQFLICDVDNTYCTVYDLQLDLDVDTRGVISDYCMLVGKETLHSIM